MSRKNFRSVVFALAFLALSACGAVPNPSQPAGTQPSPNPVTAATAEDLTAAVEEIFATSCALSGCHAGTPAESGMSLEATRYLSDTVDVPARQLETMVRILRGEPDRSYLIHKVRGTHRDAGGSGSRMPSVRTPLPLESITTLENWIISLAYYPDTDGDGSGADVDCDDTDPAVHPGARDITGNTVDEDCSGVALDADGDGHSAMAEGGTDADDNDPATNPDAAETCFDAVDNDQDGSTDEGCQSDMDNDGHDSIAAGGDDTDDNDASIYPGAPEICGDDKDNDQNGASDENPPCDPNVDNDGDGETENQGDCNDNVYAISTTATEIGGNAIDENCDGITEDRDNDGHNATGIGPLSGNDCNDQDGSIHPGATDTPDNGIDEDCDGLDDTTMTFARVASEIYGSCQNSSCHNAADPAQNLNLSSGAAYSQTVNVASEQLPAMVRVKPGEPNSSYVLRKLKGTHLSAGGSGERMPKDAAPLSSSQLLRYSNWIAHGAQNN